MKPTIAGIQQVGIGIPDVHEAFKWYRQHFGMDIPVFEEAAEANLMLPYTGNKPHMRHAILAINMKGGGGFEIWQYTSRKPQPATFDLQIGDLGFFCAKMKSSDVRGSYDFLKSRKVDLISEIVKDPSGNETFFLRDPWNNLFQVVKSDSWFGNGKQLTGGPSGMMIGVSDIERSKKFYSEILGYDTVVYDKDGIFPDLKNIPSGTNKMRRVLLKHSNPRVGAFSKLLGESEIELIKVYDRAPRKIFENRFWGDQGFIHLCFDITNQNAMKELCASKGHPFTVDSGEKFDMGEAAGHFSYIEDPDGALIEFVETKKIPILKKLGWYLDLRKRDATRPLPDWMLKALKFNRVND
ncbi:MAG TPA: VOC family protein [Bacteroidia bacterium]|jgi:catechol 2,3-dioxygenase-like lactoylglutathione lyase family enzyme